MASAGCSFAGERKQRRERRLHSTCQSDAEAVSHAASTYNSNRLGDKQIGIVESGGWIWLVFECFYHVLVLILSVSALQFRCTQIILILSSCARWNIPWIYLVCVYHSHCCSKLLVSGFPQNVRGHINCASPSRGWLLLGVAALLLSCQNQLGTKRKRTVLQQKHCLALLSQQHFFFLNLYFQCVFRATWSSFFLHLLSRQMLSLQSWSLRDPAPMSSFQSLIPVWRKPLPVGGLWKCVSENSARVSRKLTFDFLGFLPQIDLRANSSFISTLQHIRTIREQKRPSAKKRKRKHTQQKHVP